MTRQLVLTNEAARHPFRQRLPRPSVPALAASAPRSGQFFMHSVAAAFVAFYGFLL